MLHLHNRRRPPAWEQVGAAVADALFVGVAAVLAGTFFGGPISAALLVAVNLALKLTDPPEWLRK
jgi:hypothetical protein